MTIRLTNTRPHYVFYLWHVNTHWVVGYYGCSYLIGEAYRLSNRLC